MSDVPNIQAVDRMVQNAMTMRQQFLKQMFDPRRNIEEECGYPEVNPSAMELRRMYDRHGLASRVVGLKPEECWQLDPEIRENEDSELTEFEDAFKTFQEQHNLIHFMMRADEISGIGRYGIMLFGLDDGQQLHQPVAGISEDGTPTPRPGNHRVTFLRVFDESLVDVVDWEQDPTNPRFGEPKFYHISFVDPTTSTEGTSSQPDHSIQKKVHWSRVIHLCDERTTSEVVGNSRQLVVWDRLLDARKIFGGNGEMYWRGAFPGVSVESQPQNEDVELDIAATRDQMELYMNGLQRYLMTTGMTAKSLTPQVASPEPHFKTMLLGITIPLKVPYRIFVGSEQASMASTQDIETWRGRMNTRNQRYTIPNVIKPVVQRLIDYGALPTPQATDDRGYPMFKVVFPDLNAPTDEQKLTNAAAMTEAMAKYVQSGSSELIPEREFLTIIMDFDEEQADAILEAAMQRINDQEEEQAALDEALSERLSTDPTLRLAPPEGAERIPEITAIEQQG